MLDLVTPGSASRIYEVRAEYGNGLVRAFGARRDRMEAEVLLGETIKRVEAAARARYNRYWIEEIDTTGSGSRQDYQRPGTATRPASALSARPGRGRKSMLRSSTAKP